MKKILIILIVLPLFITQAYAKGMKMREGHHSRKGKILKELGLEEEQIKQIRQIRKESKEKIKQIRKEVKTLKNDMHQALKRDTSLSELKKLHNKIWKKKETIAQTRFDSVIKIRDILDVEQRKKFYQFQQERRKHRREGRGKRRGRGRHRRNRSDGDMGQ